MAFAAAGSLIQGTATSFAMTTVTAGDFVLLEIVVSSSNTVYCTAVSGGGCNWTQTGSVYFGVSHNMTAAIFTGRVTAAGSATVTLSFSGSTPTFFAAGQEFSSATGAWVLDQQGNLDGVAGSTWPSLTPAASGELYFGYAYDTGTAVAGATSGYTYDVDAHTNGLAFNPACTASAQAPVWGDSGQLFGSMILLREMEAGIAVFAEQPATTISGGGTTAPAAGTTETWTAATWAPFPVASNATTPPAYFTVADTAAGYQSEEIRVLNTSTGLVLRGANGTTPVAHQAGFRVTQVIDAGTAGNWPQEYNVRSRLFGAKGDGTTDDTAAIQAALTACRGAGGGIVRIPAGTYLLSSALVPGSSVTLTGDGPGITHLTMTGGSSTANGIDTTGLSALESLCIENMTIEGPHTGSGIGIKIGSASTLNPPFQVSLRNLTVDGWGTHGVELDNTIASEVTLVISLNNGGTGFYLNGTAASCTSITLKSCYAVNNTSGNGYWLENCNYTALVGNAADNNATAYLIDSCNLISVSGCGAEILATGFEITGCSGVSLQGCSVYQATSEAFWVTGNSAGVVLDACSETGPNGATASFKVDSGSSAQITQPVYTTAVSLASGMYGTVLSDQKFTGSVGIGAVPDGTAGDLTVNNNCFVAGNMHVDNPGTSGFFELAGISDGVQYANFSLAQAGGSNSWTFAHLLSHSLVITSYNGTSFISGLTLTQPGALSSLYNTLDDSSGNMTAAGNIDVATAGKGLQVKEGTNAKQGTATLSSGTAVVSNTSVTASSRIFLTAQDNSTAGALRVSARTAGTSFTITSSNGTDSGVVAYEIFEPG